MGIFKWKGTGKISIRNTEDKEKLMKKFDNVNLSNSSRDTQKIQIEVKRINKKNYKVMFIINGTKISGSFNGFPGIWKEKNNLLLDDIKLFILGKKTMIVIKKLNKKSFIKLFDFFRNDYIKL